MEPIHHLVSRFTMTDFSKYRINSSHSPKQE